MLTEIPKTFIFNNTADEMYPLMTDAIAYLEEHTSLDDVTASKVRMVLVELLTNAIKHSGNKGTDIGIELCKDRIIITKTDEGYPLNIFADGVDLNWPLPGIHHGGRIINVYGDGNLLLKGLLEGNCVVKFFVKEGSVEENINNLPEHFGLMIMAQVSDSFTYEFDINNCSNKFKASITLM